MRYSESVTMITMIMRLLPNWIRAAVAVILLSTRGVQSNLQMTKKTLIPIINKRRESEKNNPD